MLITRAATRAMEAAAAPHSPARALLDEALALASSGAPDADTRRGLVRLLHKVSPDRRRLPPRAGDASNTRLRPADADVAALLDCVRADLAAAVRAQAVVLSPYRAVERRFRPPGGPANARQRPAASARGVASVADAVALGGALDFGDATGAAQVGAGVVCLVPPSPLEAVAAGCGDGGSNAAGLRRGGLYALASHPGFYVLPGYLAVAEQEAVARSILRRHVERPNRRNVDAAFDPDASNLMAAAAVEAAAAGGGADAAASSGAAGGVRTMAGGDEGGASDGMSTAARHSDGSAVATTAFPAGLWAEHMAAVRRGMHTRPPEVDGGHPAAGSVTDHVAATMPPERGGWLARLAWATLGQQYDWTARQYHLPGDPDYQLHARPGELAAGGDGAASPGVGVEGSQPPGRWYAPMPPELAAMSADVAAQVEAAVAAAMAGRLGVIAPDPTAAGLPMCPFICQSGIVNVYQGSDRLRQPMGGHVDDMERRVDRPVVSLSLGCTGVYLLGGPAKEDAPTPVLVRSGDVLLLSGATRLAHHGVARVFEGSAPAGLFGGPPRAAGAPSGSRQGSPGALAEDALDADAVERSAFRAFLSCSRLNINVRQVV